MKISVSNEIYGIKGKKEKNMEWICKPESEKKSKKQKKSSKSNISFKLNPVKST